MTTPPPQNRSKTHHIVTIGLLVVLIAGPAIAPGPALTPGQATVTDGGLSADGANITRLYTVDTTAGYRLYLGNLTDAPYLTSGAADTISTPDTLQVDGRAKLSHTNSSICLGDGASTYDACLFRSTTSEVQASDDLAVTDDLRVGDDVTVTGDMTVNGKLQFPASYVFSRTTTLAGGASESLDADTSSHALVGLLIVAVDEGTGGAVCLVSLKGTNGPTEVSDTSGACTMSSTLSGDTTGIYYDSYYRIKLGTVGHTVRLMFHGYSES